MKVNKRSFLTGPKANTDHRPLTLLINVKVMSLEVKAFKQTAVMNIPVYEVLEILSPNSTVSGL